MLLRAYRLGNTTSAPSTPTLRSGLSTSMTANIGPLRRMRLLKRSSPLNLTVLQLYKYHRRQVCWKLWHLDQTHIFHVIARSLGFRDLNQSYWSQDLFGFSHEEGQAYQLWSGQHYLRFIASIPFAPRRTEARSLLAACSFYSLGKAPTRNLSIKV